MKVPKGYFTLRRNAAFATEREQEKMRKMKETEPYHRPNHVLFLSFLCVITFNA